MVAQRGTPTVGPDSGQNYAGQVNTEFANVWDMVINVLTVTGGTGDAITATCATAPLDAYVKGQYFSYIPSATNSNTDPQINVDSRGNKTIKDEDGLTIPGAKLVVGRIYLLYYDGTFLRIISQGSLVRFLIFVEAKPSTSERVLRLVMTDSVSFPAGMSLSRASAAVASAGTVAFKINKNGAQFAQIVFTASATGVVSSFPSSPAVATGFVAGDVLEIIAPTIPDGSLSDISITLAATH